MGGRGGDGGSPGLSQKAEIRNTHVQGQEKVDVSIQAKRANSPFLYLFALLSFGSMDWIMPTGTGRVLFTQSTDSNANLETPSQTHPEKNVLPAIWPFRSPVKLTHKFNHHTVFAKKKNLLLLPA